MSRKTYIISGATGGIGRAVVSHLYPNNNLIFVSKNKEKLDSLAQEYPDSQSFLGNILEPDFMENVVAQTSENYSSLDGYVHCIGSILLKPLHLTSLADWQQTLDLNLTSAFIATKAVLKPMLSNKKGSIVLFSSVAANTGMMNHSAISAAKAGIEGFIKSTAVTYANRGIRINGIAPGLVETPLSEFLWKSETARKASEGMHPVGRLGLPEDIAKGVIFLLDEQNSWLTGQLIPIDGGLGTARVPAKL